MPARLRDSSFTCGRGQIQTVEALIASAIIFSSVIFALNYPKQPGYEEFKTLQLKKVCDDLLDLLSIENSGLNTTLTIWIDLIERGNSGDVNASFHPLSRAIMENMSILTRIEIYRMDGNDLNLIYSNGTLIGSGCVSSFRIVLHNNTFYEVRVIACYV